MSDQYKTWKSGVQEYAPFTTREDNWRGIKPGSLSSWGHSSDVWKDVMEPFEATLKYKEYSKGRSSVTFYWEDIKTGLTYPMFISSLGEILEKGKVFSGEQISGRWKVIKKGSNFGIKYVGD